MIRTVTGPIKNINSAVTLMHEHISCASTSLKYGLGSCWLDYKKLKDLACKTLILMKEKYELDLFVDATPIDLGRDVKLLYEISKETGVKIVASSGFYYLDGIETINNSAQEIAEWLIHECRYGIDGTDIKPGILKCATGSTGITADNLKKLTALGITQKNTGLPLYIHCEHYGDIVYSQISILKDCGANVQKMIIGHTSLRLDIEYLENILKQGCYICMDQCYCNESNLIKISDTLVTLCKKGYSNKILISDDYCIHNDFFKRSENGLHKTAYEHLQGLGYIFEKLYESYLSRGGNTDDWFKIICINPFEVLNIDDNYS